MCVGESFVIGDGGAEMALVFCKCYFSVHSFDDIVIVDLLLYI